MYKKIEKCDTCLGDGMLMFTKVIKLSRLCLTNPVAYRQWTQVVLYT